MRAMMGDPVGAGVDTFSKVVNTIGNLEEIKDRRQRSEENRKDAAFKEEERGKLREAWGKQALLEHDEPILYDATEAEQIRQEKGDKFDPLKDWNSSHINAMLYFYNHTNMSDQKLDDVKYLKSHFQNMAQSVQGKDGKIDLTSDPRAQAAFNNVFETGKQKDIYGNDVESKPATAIAKGSHEMMPTAFEMEYKYPAGRSYKHIAYDKGQFVNMAPENPTPSGLVEQGNIDLNKRPVVKNADGSISTVLSASFNIDGKEVLVPKVSDDGKILTDEEALKNYKKTGNHLGIFDNEKDADIYAEQLHNSKVWKADIDYYGKETNRDTLRMGDGGDPNAPIHALPAQLLYGKLDVMDDMMSAVHHYRAKVGGTKFLEQLEATGRKRKENTAAMEALETSKGDFKVFAETLMKKNPDMDLKDAKVWFDALQKSRPKMESKAGKTMEDREKLIAEAGGDENAPSVKQFDELAKRDEKREPGVTKTIYGPRGQTREVRITEEEAKAGWNPPSGWSLKAPKEFDPTAAQIRKDAEVDKVRKNYVELYDPNAKSPNDLDHLDDKAKARLDKKIRDAEDYVRNTGKSANEAIHHFEDQKEKSDLKPITKPQVDSIVKKLTTKLGRKPTRKEAIAEAKRKGLDPDKIAGE